MAAAFLPWEKWLARLLHPIAVAIKRWLYQVRRSRCLERSRDWPRAEGTVIAINWDSSCPREEILYSYSTEQGYQSGTFWHAVHTGTRRTLNPLIAGREVLIVGMNAGEVINGKKSPQQRVNVSKGLVMLMSKKAPFPLRNIGKESVDLLVIEVRK